MFERDRGVVLNAAPREIRNRLQVFREEQALLQEQVRAYQQGVGPEGGNAVVGGVPACRVGRVEGEDLPEALAAFGEEIGKPVRPWSHVPDSPGRGQGGYVEKDAASALLQGRDRHGEPSRAFSLKKRAPRGGRLEQQGVRPALTGALFGNGPAAVAHPGASVDLPVAVQDFGPQAAVGDPHPVGPPRHGCEVEDRNDRLFRRPALSQETDDAAVGILKIDPLEPLCLTILLVQGRFRGVEAVQVLNPPLNALVNRVFEGDASRGSSRDTTRSIVRTPRP